MFIKFDVKSGVCTQFRLKPRRLTKQENPLRKSQKFLKTNTEKYDSSKNNNVHSGVSNPLRRKYEPFVVRKRRRPVNHIQQKELRTSSQFDPNLQATTKSVELMWCPKFKEISIEYKSHCRPKRSPESSSSGT